MITFQRYCLLAVMARFPLEAIVEYLEGRPSALDDYIAEGSDDDLNMESEGAKT